MFHVEQNAMPKTENLDKIIQSLPHEPGVYQFFGADGIIIYVGKAKDLRKRVSSYFNRQKYENRKLQVLVSKVSDIQYFVVDSEAEALLLENSLVKKHQPRYNILLKDDKTFPWICIRNEHFPRVFLTRNRSLSDSVYFGPYTSVKVVRSLLDMFRQLYHLRTCPLLLSADNIAKRKFKVCLEHHIGNCLGPCVGLQSEADYNESITQIRNILKGNIQDVLSFMRKQMEILAASYKFEEAAKLKEKYSMLDSFRHRSTVVSNQIRNVEVYSIVDEPRHAFVNFMRIVDGAIVQTHTVEIIKVLDEPKDELLAYAIMDIRQSTGEVSPEIIVPFELTIEFEGARSVVPKIGEKRKLLELSERNARFFMLERNKQLESAAPKSSAQRILERLQTDLNLSTLPLHIECFDNSNIQGTNPVAACVVFKNARPYKSDYRHFTIKTVEGSNDFASMEEVVYRRYRRMLDEGSTLPNLIVIDGGKGQLSSAFAALASLGIEAQLPIIGIAKRLEEIFRPGDSVPLYLDKKSESLKLIQHMRNEAHRFGITFHRQKRSAGMVKSALEDIEGIGPKTIERLLNTFKSVDNIRLASHEQLAVLVGEEKAARVLSGLKG